METIFNLDEATQKDLIKHVSQEYGLAVDGDGKPVFSEEKGGWIAEIITRTGENGIAIKDELITVAGLVPTGMRNATNFLQQVSDYDSLTLDRVAELKICWELYEVEGAVGSAIDVLVELALTPGFIQNCTDPLKKLLTNWMKNVNGFIDFKILDPSKSSDLLKLFGAVPESPGMTEFLSDALLYYFVTGDAVITEDWNPKLPVTIDGKAGTYNLPQFLHLHRSEDIEVEKQLLALGQEAIYLNLNTDIVGYIKNPVKGDPMSEFVKNNVSDYIRQMVTKKNITKILLPPIITTHLKRKGRGRQYGRPYVRRAFSAVASKRRLQALDQATITGLLQRLIIVCLGVADPKSPLHIPKPARVGLLQQALSNLKTQKMLIWGGPDIDVKDIGPDGKILSFEGRFNEADDNISLALGIPRILIDGQSSGTSSRDWATFTSTISRLEHIRNRLKLMIDKWFLEIAVRNNFQNETPTWRWSPITLRDENSTRLQALKIYEDGVLSVGDTQEMLGFNSEDALARMEEEFNNKLYDKIYAPRVSFSKGASPLGGRPSGEPATPPGQIKLSPKGKQPPLGTPTPSGMGYEQSVEAEDTPIELKYWNDQLGYSYTKMTEMVDQDIDKRGVNLPELLVSLTAGFVFIRHITENLLQAEFTLNSGMKDSVWLQRVVAWNNHYLDRWKDYLNRGLTSLLTDSSLIADPTMAKIAVRDFLNASRYRLPMYVREGIHKTKIASELLSGDRDGVSMYTLVAKPDACESCKPLDGQIFRADEILNLIPLHNFCRCIAVKKVT